MNFDNWKIFLLISFFLPAVFFVYDYHPCSETLEGKINQPPYDEAVFSRSFSFFNDKFQDISLKMFCGALFPNYSLLFEPFITLEEHVELLLLRKSYLRGKIGRFLFLSSSNSIYFSSEFVYLESVFMISFIMMVGKIFYSISMRIWHHLEN